MERKRGPLSFKVFIVVHTRIPTNNGAVDDTELQTTLLDPTQILQLIA